MKFLKKFATRAEYDAFMEANESFPFVGYIEDEGKVEYLLKSPNTEFEYLNFEALEDMSVSFSSNEIEYSFDAKTWRTLSVDTPTPVVSAGNKIYFRAMNLTPNYSSGIGSFSTTGKFKAAGNIMSMCSGSDFVENKTISASSQFKKLFYNCTNLISAYRLVLPANVIESNCYSNMFYGCTNLVESPKILPATTLKAYCYQYMFYGCTSLVSVPELPAVNPAIASYEYMFRNCTSLVSAQKILPLNIVYGGEYREMFAGCTSLVNAPELPATTLNTSCYYKMFAGCTSLETAPELPAKSLLSECYESMFEGCTKLNYVKALFTNSPSKTYTENWLKGVAATGTFVKNAEATWDVTGVDGVPSGWTVETATE